MLMKHMERDCEQVCFGTSNRFVVFDAQETQKHLLSEILSISGSIAQARRKKTTQPMAVLSFDVRYEGLFVA
jgi:hypothetical protein